MKHATYLIFLIMLFDSVYAQEIKLGLTGGINTTWLFNKNVATAGEHLNQVTTFGVSAGVNTIFSFNEKAAVSLGVIHSGHNQKYHGVYYDVYGNVEAEYESQLQLTYLDVPLFFRLQSKKGPYLELGPQLSFLLSAKEDYHIDPQVEYVKNYSNKDFSENFRKNNIAAVMGVGFDFDASSKISIATGLRFGYGLMDVTNEYSEAELMAFVMKDRLSYATAISHQGENQAYHYEPTKRFFGGLLLGINYSIRQ